MLKNKQKMYIPVFQLIVPIEKINSVSNFELQNFLRPHGFFTLSTIKKGSFFINK